MRNDDGKTVYEKRNQNAYDENDRKVNQQNMNLHERQNFMDGKKVMTLPRSLAPSLPRSLAPSRARARSAVIASHTCVPSPVLTAARCACTACGNHLGGPHSALTEPNQPRRSPGGACDEARE